MARKIQLRRDTAVNWSNTNPVLAQGEVGVDLTNVKIKIGNGTASWTTLPYFDDKETDFAGYATTQYVDDEISNIVIPTDVSDLNDTQGLLDNLYASIQTAGSEIDIDFDQSLIEITLNQTINTIDFVNIPLAGTTKSTTVVFIQDASGNRTVSGLGYLTQGGIGLQLSATANSISVINFTAYGSTIIGFNVGQDYQ